MKTLLLNSLVALTASIATAGEVNPGVIFGDGNANGSFTIDTANGIELGIRAKVRFNAAGLPENTFNYDGIDTYTFKPNDGSPPAGHSMWSFDWSINSDVAGTSGDNLTAFTYQLALFKINADGTDINDAVAFDPINTIYADHSIGNNLTTDATDMIAGDPFSYAALIASNNVAQNSWRYGWFDGAPGTALENWDPNELGTYIIRLTAFNGGMEMASTDININVVPLPTGALAGLGLLGTLAGIRIIRRRS